MNEVKILPLDILRVGVSDSQVCTQSGQAQGIESARSILVVPQIVLIIARKMVHLDVVAHLQQLVQARGWLTGIHVNWIIRLTWRLKMGSKVRLFIYKTTRSNRSIRNSTLNTG